MLMGSKVWTPDEYQAQLKPYGSFFDDGRFQCPKCGMELEVRLMPATYFYHYGGYLEYNCGRCGYKWQTKTADAK
jgi:DNA-directed RNA polymerase subunit RPC12/RpoP